MSQWNRAISRLTLGVALVVASCGAPAAETIEEGSPTTTQAVGATTTTRGDDGTATTEGAAETTTTESSESEPVPGDPEARVGAAMVYDSESDMLVMYGGAPDGSGGTRALPDTWTYDPEAGSWFRMSDGPPVLFRQAMAYDSQSDRIVIFGGMSVVGSNIYADSPGQTWAFDTNADHWTHMEASVAPEEGLVVSSRQIYDSETDRIVLDAHLGGRGEDWYGSWEYDYEANAWSETERPAWADLESNHPGGLSDITVVHDPTSNRLLVIGGTLNEEGKLRPTVSDEFWAFDLEDNTWTELAPIPQPLALPAAAVDQKRGLMVVFSGGQEKGGTIPVDLMLIYDLAADSWTAS